jgi:hypothetical protein
VGIEVNIQVVAVADGVAADVPADFRVEVPEPVVVQGQCERTFLCVGEPIIARTAGAGNAISEGFVVSLKGPRYGVTIVNTSSCL